MAAKRQTESQISVYEFPENVRRKPGMYLGAGSDAATQAIKEPVDNCIDEALAGRNNFVGIAFQKDGTIVVWDHGGGVPVKKLKTGRSALVEVFGSLHAGSKMGDANSAKSASVGTHGVGAACTNAISSFFTAVTCRDGKWYSVEFVKGKLKRFGKAKPPKLPNGKTAKLGTVITFKLELDLLGKGTKILPHRTINMLDVSSYLYPEVKFCIIDNFDSGKTYNFHQPDGYKALLVKRSEALAAELTGEPFVIATKNLNVVMQWSNHDELAFESYVNGSHTKEDGTHMTGFLNAFNKALEPYKGKAKFKSEDIRMGLIGILNYKMAAPAFDSQTKEKLKSDSAREDVEMQAYKELEKYFRKNKTFIKGMCKRAVEFSKLREEFSQSKKAIAELGNRKEKSLLPTKLKWVTSKDPKEIELFLVEGDSASGTCSTARDRKFQAVLALRGKFINVYGAQKKKAFQDESILNILRSIGYDPKQPDPFAKLRVGKIILLMDEDEDGHHLTILTLSLLNKILPETLIKKMVYIVNAPLYTCAIGSQKIYASSRQELLKKVPKGKKPDFITRIKGWGEVSPKLLHEVAFNKKTRSLLRITDLPKDKEIAYASLVGQDASYKRQLLGLGEKRVTANA